MPNHASSLMPNESLYELWLEFAFEIQSLLYVLQEDPSLISNSGVSGKLSTSLSLSFSAIRLVYL